MKTKSFNCLKNSTRGFLKTEFNEIETPIPDKSNLNAKEMKLLEMNPKIKLNEMKKIQASNQELNKNNQTEKIKVNDTNKRPLTTMLNKVKANQSNIFHSDVIINNKKIKNY